MKKTLIVLLVGCLTAMGCHASFPSEKQDRMTIAKVQKEIKVGMSSADVVEVLGSPNMVTTDDLRRETWVYDKISTQIDSSGSEMGVWFLLGAGGSSRASSRTSQKTLTIIVKFDNSNKVRDFAYRTSSF